MPRAEAGGTTFSVTGAPFKTDDMKIKYEYMLFPVSFTDIGEIIDQLNEYGENGWEVTCHIQRYADSPVPCTETIDFILKRLK